MDANPSVENATVRRAELKRLENLQKLVEPLLQDADHLNKLEYKLQRTTSSLRISQTDNKLLLTKLNAAHDALTHHKALALASSAALTHRTHLSHAESEHQIATANRRIADMHAQHTQEAARRADIDADARHLAARCTAAERAAQHAVKLQRAAEERLAAARKDGARLHDDVDRAQQREEEQAKRMKKLQEQCDAYSSRCQTLELRVRELEKTPLHTPHPTPVAASPAAPHTLPVPLGEWDLISPAPLMRVRPHADTSAAGTRPPLRGVQFVGENGDGVSESESRSRDTGDMPFAVHDLFYDVPCVEANGRAGAEKEVLRAATGDRAEEEEVLHDASPTRKENRKRPFASRRTRVRARSATAKRPRRPHKDAEKGHEMPSADVPAPGSTADVPVNGGEEAVKDGMANSTANGMANGDANSKGRIISDYKANRKTKTKPADAPRSSQPVPETGRRSRRVRPPVSYDYSAGNDICTAMYDFMPYRSRTPPAPPPPPHEEGDGLQRSRKRKSLPAGYRAPAAGSPIRKGKRRGGKSERNT